MDEPDPKEWEQYWRGEELYAYVESLEQVRTHDEATGGTTMVVLDLVPKRRITWMLDGSAAENPEIPFTPTAQLGATFRDEELPKTLALLSEGDWISCELSAPRRQAMDLYSDIGAGATAPVHATFAPLDKTTAAKLQKFSSLADFPKLSSNEHGALEARLQNESPAFVTVMDVGQGNANAVNSDDGLPFAYFDLGAGCLWNTHTRPRDLVFCTTKNPIVVLSHWDFDHWFGATLPNRRGTALAHSTGIESLDWIAPQQSVGVRTLKFAQGLAKQGHLRILSSGSYLKPGQVEIVSCIGTTKNDSGLALYVQARDGLVMCPGDADFKCVPPSSLPAPLVGLVASHHGSSRSVDIGTVPPAAAGGRVAFSFGKDNRYGHPGQSPHIYASGGWSIRRDTPQGAVCLGGAVIRAPCGGQWCTNTAIQ